MSIFSNTHLAQLYVASKMNDLRFPHVVEVPVPVKTHKYKRFAHEKRTKRVPGVKRVQTPHVMVTKWDVENANKKHKKVGRARDRANKYGNWSENRTDAYYEDLVNGNEQDQLEQRLKTKESLNEYNLPVVNLANQDSWPSWAWESYNEKEETAAAWEDIDNAKELSREEYYQAWHDILNSQEQLAVNAARNAQEAALYGDVLYTIELDGETDEAEWDGALTEIDEDTDDEWAGDI
jgi:hypothetical protein